MEKRNDGDDDSGVVTAAGFAVTDPRGRTRVLIGDVVPPGDEWRPGVAIYDEDGTERMSLLLGDAGPVLSYAAGRNTGLEVGVIDRHTEGSPPGPYLLAVDRDGDEAWSVRVTDDGVEQAP